MRAALLLPLSLAACAAPIETAPAPVEPEVATLRDPSFEPVRAPARFAPDLFTGAPALQPGAAPRAPAAQIFREGMIPGLQLTDESDLETVMGYLARASGVSIVVEDRAQEAIDDEGISFHVKLSQRMTLTRALELLQELSNDAFGWNWYGPTALVITTPDRVKGDPKTYVYDISDLLVGVPSYVPRVPSFDVSPTGGLFPPDEDFDPDARPGVIDESMLLDLIENTIAPGTWDEPGNSISIRDGKLIVRHR